MKLAPRCPYALISHLTRLRMWWWGMSNGYSESPARPTVPTRVLIIINIPSPPTSGKIHTPTSPFSSQHSSFQDQTPLSEGLAGSSEETWGGGSASIVLSLTFFDWQPSSWLSPTPLLCCSLHLPSLHHSLLSSLHPKVAAILWVSAARRDDTPNTRCLGESSWIREVEPASPEWQTLARCGTWSPAASPQKPHAGQKVPDKCKQSANNSTSQADCRVQSIWLSWTGFINNSSICYLLELSNFNFMFEVNMQCVISAPLAALNEIGKIMTLKHAPVFHYLDKQIVLP